MRPLTATGKDNFAACVVMMVSTGIAACARLGTKFLRGQKLNGPDWMCIASLCLFYSYCAIIINFIVNKSQFGSFDMDPSRGEDEIVEILKNVYVTEVLVGIIITLAKLSLLWLYWTLFATANSFGNKAVISAAAILCITWFLIAESLIILQCNPVHEFWDKFDQEPYCLRSAPLLLGYELTNFFLDVVILLIPLAIIRRLQLARSTKVALAGIFLLGFLVCIASAVRMTKIWGQQDGIPSFSPVVVWSTVQLGAAIICSCLPTLKPALTFALDMISRLQGRATFRTQNTPERVEMPRLRHRLSSDPDMANMPGHGSPRAWAQQSQGRLPA